MLNNNTFFKTFTGTDALAFLLLPEAKPILLGSLTTLSHSVYREKKPVPLLGKINTGGYTRGMRSIAGTMVFTLINQHLIEDVMNQIPYLKEHGKLKADELPFFDIMVICANEYGAASQMMLYGVEFFEDGQVVSVQDLYIENTFSFVARDMDDFAKIDVVVSKGANLAETLTADTVVAYDYTTDGYNESYQTALAIQNKDVTKAQQELNELGYTTPITGVLDNATLNSLSLYQKDNGLTSTGYLDTTTYDLLLGNATGSVLEITNKYGSYVYSSPSKETILGIAKYQSNYIGTLTDTGEFATIKFYDQTGYVDVNDTSLAKQTLKYIYKDITPNGEINTTNLTNFDASMIGTTITSNKDSQVKTTAISYYPDGSTSVNTRYYDLTAHTSQRMTLDYIPDSYIYNTTAKALPTMVEFIVAPDNGTMTKWIVKIKDDTKSI